MPQHDEGPGSAPKGVEDSVRRAAAAAKETIDSAVSSRAAVRETRLQLQIERLAKWCRFSPPKNEVESTRVLDELLLGVMACCEARMGNLQQVDPASGALKIRVHRGFEKPFLAFFHEVHDHAACGEAFKQAGPVVVEDVATSAIFSAASRQAVLDAGVRACLSVALVTPREGRKLGVISVHYPAPGIPAVHQQTVVALAPHIAEVVELCTEPGR